VFPLYVGFVISYILGSVPTALIAGYLLGGMDIRKTGSRNAGATNLYRVFGLKPYIAVLAVDIAKGYAATAWITGLVSTSPLDDLQASVLFGLTAVFGHIFSVFAGFRGGKGVATAAGMMFALIPLPMICAVFVYIAVTSLTHYVSLGSVGAALALPAAMLAVYVAKGTAYRPELYAISLVLAAVIILTHRENIKRLLRGEERKTRFFNNA